MNSDKNKYINTSIDMWTHVLYNENIDVNVCLVVKGDVYYEKWR